MASSRTNPLSRLRRADARRNQEKILAAARAAFGESDAEVSMAEISRRADVGMATLYRNFPSRRELLEAVYTDDVNDICEAAMTVDAETPGAALIEWLQRFFTFFTSKRHVGAELLRDSGSDNPVFSDGRARVLAAGRPLLVSAQRSHEIRKDLTIEQVADLVKAVASIQGDASYLAPILQAALDGLRPSSEVKPA